MTARRAVIAVAAGAALSLAFPEPDLGPLAWVAIAPLIALATGTRPRPAAAAGALFGLGFFGTLLAWVAIVGYVAWAVLVALQATFLALFAAAYARVSTRIAAAPARVVAAALLWVAVDFLRARVPLGGFTWGQLAQGQADLWTLRPAAIGGAWLVALLVVAVNALVADAVAARRPTSLAAAAALVALPLALPTNERTGEPVRVAIVQGNVPRDFTGSSLEREIAITRSHARLTRALDPDEVDVAVWPESSLGLDYRSIPEVEVLLAGAARALGRPIVAGGNLDLPRDRYAVMAFLVSAGGDVVERYQKTHLVPFGEYVPARAWLDWIPMLEQVPRDAVAGRGGAVFDVAGGRLAPVISFEGDFGSLVRERIAAGGRLLVVATNTSTWGESWASAQHVAFSRVRAVENGVWVAHAAISGISAAIAPDGEVVGRLPLWEAGTLVREMTFVPEVTFYARSGDWAAWGSVVLSLGLVAASRRDRR